MSKINWFYISMLVLLLGALWFFKPEKDVEIAFYGFAENLETEVNYNYPVIVEKILVSTGQHVVKGKAMILLSRSNEEANIQKEPYDILTVEAEKKAWIDEKNMELAAIMLEKDTKLSEIDAEINTLQKDLDYRRSVAEQFLDNGNTEIYSPMSLELNQLQEERSNIIKDYEHAITAINREISLGKTPFQRKIEKLEAEIAFDSFRENELIEVLAPSDGLIGDLDCKEAEHIAAFKPLLTFYEPHSSIVKGFVHEEMYVDVNLGDQFEVSSLQDTEMKYPGKVIGLGSRIVEIPSRLRKYTQIKSYGREITIEIPEVNSFLQKEKVSITYSGKKSK